MTKSKDEILKACMYKHESLTDEIHEAMEEYATEKNKELIACLEEAHHILFGSLGAMPITEKIENLIKIQYQHPSKE